MKSKKSVIYFLAVLLISVSTFKAVSQNCSVYFPTVKGTIYEMQQFDNKDKQTGTSTYTVNNSITDTEGNVAAIIHIHSQGKSDKDTMSANVSYKCENGKAYVDMKNFIPSGSSEQYKDMEIKTDASWMEIPQALSVGTTMVDATGTMSFYSNGTLFMTMKISITDRKVASSESVTTPAGTFQCYKVTYNIASESSIMGIKTTINSKAVEYYSTGTGIVKSETYNKNDKLEGYSVLSKITKP